ncbi:hypothetical protein ACHAW6_006479 [Cyclotella cf. meneghiniana]
MSDVCDEWAESSVAAPLLSADDHDEYNEHDKDDGAPSRKSSVTTAPLEINEDERQPRGFPTLCLILTPIAVLLPLLFVLASLLPPPPPHAPPNLQTFAQSAALADALQIPTAIHLGLTSEVNARYIQFSTGVQGKPIVEIAKKILHRNNYINAEPLQWTKLTGSTTTYYANDMCQPPANKQEPGYFVPPGYWHTIKATHLEAHSRYIYRVGLAMGQGVRWSEYFEFQTDAPVVGHDTTHYQRTLDPSSSPLLTFLALGDQGCEQQPSHDDETVDLHVRPGKAAPHDVANLITSLIDNQTISSIHHIGDLSYANGAGHLWDLYMSMIQPYASRVPIVVAVGNHEYDHTDGGDNGKDPSGVISTDGFQPYWGDFGQDSGGECGVPLSKRFAVPENGNGVYWYSFEQPLVHTIVLSSEHNLTADSPQYNWLNQDLQAVNRTTTPWLIVEMHRPMYDKYQQQDTIAVAMEYEIEDLLYEHNVDIVLGAHFHSYLRTCDGLFRGKCNNGGPIHIIVGTGGAPLDGGRHATSPWIEKYDASHWGVGKASVLDGSLLHWEFIALGGKVEDEFLITRNRR